MMVKKAVLVAVVAVVLKSVDAYVPLARHSLIAPFENFKQHTGERHVNHWDIGGHASAKQNFIRLTNDQQSRRGWIMNTEKLEQKEFGLQLKFRISGSGKHLYGDGLGLWLTKKDPRNPSFSEGLVLGHSDQFVGFGILFDTFRNVEQGHVHKDISVLVSDGRQPVSLDKDRPGCESHYRFYEGREDFSVDNMSIARIWLEKGRLSLEVDKYGRDEWKQCFNINLADYKLPDDWQENVYLSVSASTGALADNHDVLEIKVAEPTKFTHLLKIDEEERDAPTVQIDLHPKISANEVGEHVNDLAFEVSDIDKALKKLQHKVEHDIEKVKLNLERMLKKLEEKEEGSEHRIEELEKAREKSIERKLEVRLGKLEDEIRNSMESRLAMLEVKFKSDVKSVESSSGGWKMPLIAIVVLVGAYMAYTARSLNKLHRRDKLI